MPNLGHNTSSQPDSCLGRWNWHAVLCAISLIFAIYMIVSFLNAGLIADDSYIIARYAANFVTKGELVYNLGERINAVTSPLMLAIYVALTFCFPDVDPVLLFCRIAVCSFVITCILATVCLRRMRSEILFVFVIFYATSPFYFVWMTGGLETPILSLLVFGAYLKFIIAGDSGNLARSPIFGLTILCAILTRYESILLFLPMLLGIFRSCVMRRDVKGSIFLLLFGLGIPCLWLAFCQLYYGHYLPTSFSKTSVGLSFGGFWYTFVFGSIYVYEFGVYTGFLFVACILTIWRIVYPAAGSSLLSLRNWQAAGSLSLWLGLVLFSCYACLFSTVHMMYAYRMLVPLIPVLALMISLGMESIWDEIERKKANLIAVSVVLFVFILSLNVVNFVIILKSSINPSRIGELRGKWDIPTYFSEVQLAGQAIRNHWEGKGSATRPPVVASPNEGYFAYKFCDWTIVGGSVTDDRPRPYVDYHVVEANIHDQELKMKSYEVIYSGKDYSRVHSRGNVSRVLVYWDSDALSQGE